MRSFEVLTHFLSVPRAANYVSAIQQSYWSRHTNTVYQLKLPIFKRLYAKRKVQPKTCERRGTNLGLLSFILNHSLCPQLASAKYIDTWIKFIIIIIIITNSTAGCCIQKVPQEVKDIDEFTSQWRPKLPKKWTVFVAFAAQNKSPPFLNIKVGKAYMEYVIIRGKTAVLDR